MHDKPTPETKSAHDRLTELPDRVAELSAVDPADAPKIADAIAAALENSLESAPGSTGIETDRDPDSVAGER